jgi:hypothetical protein
MHMVCGIVHSIAAHTRRGSAPVSLMGLSTNLWRKSSLYSVCAMSAMIMPKPGIGSGTGAILNLVLLGPWCEVPFFA